MTDIVKMSKNGTPFYPQTHYQAVLGLEDYVYGLLPNAGIDQATMSNYVLNQLKAYATKSDIPSLASYAKLTDIPNIDLSLYALKTDIPSEVDLTNYATQDYVNSQIDDVANKVDVSAITTNTQPVTYVKNYAGLIHKEVKETDSIGITSDLLPADITSTYCIVTSDIPPIVDYGYPAQVARLTQSSRPVSLQRIGLTDTTWSSWELMTTW